MTTKEFRLVTLNVQVRRLESRIDRLNKPATVIPGSDWAYLSGF